MNRPCTCPTLQQDRSPTGGDRRLIVGLLLGALVLGTGCCANPDPAPTSRVGSAGADSERAAPCPTPAQLEEALRQDRQVNLQPGSRREELKCAGDHATVWCVPPEAQPASPAQVLLRREQDRWRVLNVGTQGVCADLAPALQQQLGCAD